MGAVKQAMLEELDKRVNPYCPHGVVGDCEATCLCGHICAEHGPECSGANDCDCPHFAAIETDDDDDDVEGDEEVEDDEGHQENCSS